MICNWIYKGKKFNSELELDDFLINHGSELYGKYKDIVFLKSTLQLFAMHKCEELRESSERELKKKFKNEYDHKIIGNHDTELENVEAPYVAVTAFISGLRDVDTHKLFFPEFIPDTKEIDGETIIGYFPRRYDLWKSGVFTTKEIDDFFDGDASRIKSSYTNDELEQFRRILEQKWESQAKIGTEIHKILYNIFRTSSNGNLMYKLPEETLFEYIRPKINIDLISDSNLQEIISYGKKLHTHLEKEIGDNLTYYPEFIIWGNYVDDTGTEREVLGKIDLLAIDKHGRFHILDYKTSPEDYNKPFDTNGGYSSAKVSAFKYQLSTYNLLLQQKGLGNYDTKLYVAPLLLLNFKKDDDGNWQFDGIKAYPDYYKDLVDSLSEKAKIESNLRQYFRTLSTPDTGIDNLLTNYDANVKKLFNNVSPNVDFSDENINSLIDRRGIENKETGIWEYTTGRGNLKTFKTREELFKWLKENLEKNKNKIDVFTKSLAKYIGDTSLENPVLNDDNYSTYEFLDGYLTWINDTFKKYYSDTYEVIDTETAQQLLNLGIILIKNKQTNAIDVIRISNNILYGYNIQAKGLKKLSAKFVLDVLETTNPNSKMLESLNGNIDLITTLLAINEIPATLRGCYINDIRIVNPNLNSGISTTLEQLNYSFERLNYYAESKGENISKNNFLEGIIKLGTSYDSFVSEYKTILNRHMSGKDRRWKSFINSTSNYDKLVTGFENPIELESDLRAFIKNMETYFPELSEDIRDLDTTNDVQMLYQRANLALTYVNGVDYVLQYAKSDKYIDSFNIFTSGVSGTRTDNPGNLKNLNLNRATELTTRGYLNLRLRFQETKTEIRKAVQALKKDKGFGWIGSHTFKNKAALFEKLYREVDGDLWFTDINDSRLLTSEKKLLELSLRLINMRRYGNLSDAELESMREKSPSKYYRVPLTPGGMNSYIATEGLLNAFKHKVRSWLPKNMRMEFKNKEEAGFEPTEESLSKTVDIPKHTLSRVNIWKMTTMFDAGLSEKSRQDLLNRYSIGYFEHDLETLLLKHEFSYLQKEVMDEILPLIKAGVLNIQYQLLISGTKMEFLEDIDYLRDYVKNKIHNKSLVDEKYKAIMGYKSRLMRYTSMMALGFNPRLLYQVIEGLWKDIKLVITKPDGKYSFSSKDMISSFKDVFREAIHFGDKRSKLELINEYYALNDMDMTPNTYVERIIDDKSILYNFQTLCFRFASRPDFYNRLAIFEAHMRSDGCWEAHSEIDGVLKYDWTLDKRFNKLAKFINSNSNFETVKLQILKSGDTELKKLLSLYSTYITQMAKEGTKIKTNTGEIRLIKEGDALPKAYTTQQSEAYKSVSDMLYGYYAHEKKALIQSEFAGSLLFQMYTYWSGKKNQYLAPGSPKVMGRYEQLEKDGKLYYLDENGLPTLDDKITGVPYMVWTGQFLEGILITLNHMRKLLLLGFAEAGLIGGLSKGRELINLEMLGDTVDPNLRTAYLYNLKAITYDMAIWLLIGQWAARGLLADAKDYVKENEADNFGQALTNYSLMQGAELFKGSAMDFNFMESIGGRGIDWTPFSISMMNRTYNNFTAFLTGKLDLLKTVERQISAARQVHQILDYLFKE